MLSDLHGVLEELVSWLLGFRTWAMSRTVEDALVPTQQQRAKRSSPLALAGPHQLAQPPSCGTCSAVTCLPGPVSPGLGDFGSKPETLGCVWLRVGVF